MFLRLFEHLESLKQGRERVTVAPRKISSSRPVMSSETRSITEKPRRRESRAKTELTWLRLGIARSFWRGSVTSIEAVGRPSLSELGIPEEGGAGSKFLFDGTRDAPWVTGAAAGRPWSCGLARRRPGGLWTGAGLRFRFVGRSERDQTVETPWGCCRALPQALSRGGVAAALSVSGYG